MNKYKKNYVLYYSGQTEWTVSYDFLISLITKLQYKWKIKYITFLKQILGIFIDKWIMILRFIL